MCARKHVRVEKDMDMDLLTKVMDQVAGWAELVILHASGEPLLNPNIIDMIQYCSRKGVGTWLSTNGMLLNEKMAQSLIESPLDALVIAIDGATMETYERIRVGGRFEVVEANADRFLRMHRSANSGMMVTIQMIEMEENRSEVQLFRKRWGMYPNANVLIKPVVDWSDQYNKVVKHETGARYKEIVCDRPWNWLVVKSDGTIPLCPHDVGCNYPIGDANEENIFDIWNSSRMQAYRGELAKGKEGFDLCSSCDYHPARKRNMAGSVALMCFDMLTMTKLLFALGYKKD